VVVALQMERAIEHPSRCRAELARLELPAGTDLWADRPVLAEAGACEELADAFRLAATASADGFVFAAAVDGTSLWVVGREAGAVMPEQPLDRAVRALKAPPTPVERCSGRDDDCDGETDEGFTWEDLPPGQPCPGRGECGPGLVVCRADGTAATCSTLADGPDPEQVEAGG